MKRFLFIFALVVSLFLPGAGSVAYAAPDVWVVDWLTEQGLPVPDLDKYYIIDENFDTYYFLYKGDQKANNYDYYFWAIAVNSGDGLKFVRDSKTGLFTYTTSSGDVVEEVWGVSYDESDSKWVGCSIANENTMFYAKEDFYLASVDVLNEDGTVFFPQTPEFKILGIPEGVLIQVITQENPLKEILTLLPMVIPCLVGFVALRKALRILVTILKTA